MPGAARRDTAGVSRPRRYSLAIELTSHCNQRCGYCYNDWRADNGRNVGALATPDLLTLVNRALDEVEFDHVTLTGGEPFARADVFEVLDLCREREVGIQMISNGGLIDDALAARIAQYPIRFIQVTLNAPAAKLHNEHVRGDHFDATIRGIEALRRHGVTVAGCIVVTRKNAHLVGEVVDMFHGFGVTLVALSRFSPAGYAAASVAELLPARSDLLVALGQAQTRGAELGMDLQVTMPVPPCVVEHKRFPRREVRGLPRSAPKCRSSRSAHVASFARAPCTPRSSATRASSRSRSSSTRLR